MLKHSPYSRVSSTKGFALPTILVASIVMLIVLLAAVSATSSIRAALDEQYYNKLATAAAESGQERADACLEANDYVPTWTNLAELRPDTTCRGATISGGSLYITQYGNVRTTFIVRAPVMGDNGTAKVTVLGMTELIRASTGTVYATYSQTLVRTSGVFKNFSTDSSTGVSETCGIINQHTWCWGTGSSGSLGNGSTANSSVPVKVVRAPGLLEGRVDTSVAVGVSSACTVASGRAFCWGLNYAGKLGNNSSADSSVPVAVDTSTGMSGQLKKIVTGLSHTCALTVAGDVYCWGENTEGQLGIGSISASSMTPARVKGIGVYAGLPVTDIATSIHARHTCAIATTSSGPRAYCWGYNNSSQIGDGTTTNRESPVPVSATGVLSGRSVTDISVADASSTGSQGYACVVASGLLYCWGNNAYGQLGNNSTANSSVPVAVTASGVLSGKTALNVAVGVRHACAIARDASNNVAAYCWGNNAYGQLGNNSTVNSSVPVAVYVGAGGLQDRTITGVSGGESRGCVIADGATYCWGFNNVGQLGDGTTTNRTVPTMASYLQQKYPTFTF